MQTKEKDNLIFVRLFPGEDVFDSLREVCKKYNVETAVVLSGLGQLSSFELGFFKEKGDYVPETFTDSHELLNLTGNISKQENGYNFHLHGSFSNISKQVVGGHFIKGVVSVTGEIILLKTDLKITRRVEEETGLSGLFL